MKRKTIAIALLILALSVICSCHQMQTKRTIRLRIPQHPWEKISGMALWYTLRWTDGGEVGSLHLSQEDRSVELEVLPGQAVFAAAYPLGELSPFGAAITPLDGDGEVVMTQDDGVLANMLIDVEPTILGMLNYGLIYEYMHEKSDDPRKLDDGLLLREIQNGELSESSFKVGKTFEVGPFALSNGIWESEFLRDPAIVATDGMAGLVNLPSGVFRFLNAVDGMLLVLIIDRDGNFYSYLKPFNT